MDSIPVAGPSEEKRVYVVVRTDLALHRLDLASVAARATWATLDLASREAPGRFAAYEDDVQPKIGLRVKTQGHLERALEECRVAGLPASLVRASDGSPAAVGIGPVVRSELPTFVLKLQLLPESEPEGVPAVPGDASDALAIWIFIRQDARIPYGKLAAQAGHGLWGVTSGLLRSGSPGLDQWVRAGGAVRALEIPDLESMQSVYSGALQLGLAASFIVDAGRTVFTEPTPTVAGIGPCWHAELPRCVPDPSQGGSSPRASASDSGRSPARPGGAPAAPGSQNR